MKKLELNQMENLEGGLRKVYCSEVTGGMCFATIALSGVAYTIYKLENKTITNVRSHQELMETSNFYSDYFTV